MLHTHSSTANQRMQWVSHLLAHEGQYGEVSQMSQSQRVSRQTLYEWKAKGQRALEAALAPSPAPMPLKRRPDLQRAVLTLLVEGHASYRGIQSCLAVLLGEQVSLGTIAAIVEQAGARAQGWLGQQMAKTHVSNSDIILKSARVKFPNWGAWNILKATWFRWSRFFEEGIHGSTRGTIYDQRTVSQGRLHQRDCLSDGTRSQNHSAGRHRA